MPETEPSVSLLTGPTYSPSEAAKLIGVNSETVRRWIRRGDLAAVRVGVRLLRVTHAALERCIDRVAKAK